MSEFYKKTAFWNNVIRTLAAFGMLATAGLTELGYSKVVIWTVATTGLMSAILAIWMQDKDDNGIVDLFEE